MEKNTPIAIDQIASVEMPPITTPKALDPQPTAPAKPELDSLNRSFDPEKFLPEKDSAGRWKNRHAGRKGKAKVSAPGQQSFIPDDSQSVRQPEQGNDVQKPAAAGGPDRFDVLADVYTRAGIASLMAVFSDEWKPDDDEEYIALRNGVAAYLRATNQEDLPPGWALTLLIATYGAKRLPRPKTQGRIAGFKTMVMSWFKGRSIARAVDRLPTPEKA